MARAPAGRSTRRGKTDHPESVGAPLRAAGPERWPSGRPLDVDRVLVRAARRGASREVLLARAVPPLTASLQAITPWSADGHDWQIGDFNFLIVEFEPRPGATLFVQWWSEPLEPVTAEVCSGKWTPEARPFITTAVRRRLRALGYRLAPSSPNYRREVHIDSPAAAERVARETMEFLYDAWGWRGAALRAHLVRDRRARREFVLDALTPEDVAKTFTALGHGAEVRTGEDRRPCLHVRGEWPAIVRLPWQVQAQNLFAALHFEATEPCPLPPSAGLANMVNDGLLFGKAHVDAAGELSVTMDVRVDGGVTAEWLRRCVDQWVQVRREVRRRVQQASGDAASLAAASIVHERGLLSD